MTRIQTWFAMSVLCVLALFSPACTSAAPADANSVTCVHAECPCCVPNGDLACIDVVVEPTTPSWEYEGKTYYFCSEDCLNAFVKNPLRYAKQ